MAKAANERQGTKGRKKHDSAKLLVLRTEVVGSPAGYLVAKGSRRIAWRQRSLKGKKEIYFSLNYSFGPFIFSKSGYLVHLF